MTATDTSPTPGMRLDGDVARFSVRSGSATSVTLVVHARQGDDGHEELRFPLARRSGSDRWEMDAPGVRVGDRYHLLVDGPTGPRHDFDGSRPLLDPYARGIEPDGDGWVGVVVSDDFDWGDVERPRTPLDRTVVYEANVRTLTAANHAVPEHLRGTYAGVAHESTIAHLRRIGVTAIELLPVHASATEEWLRAAGRENAWGYNTLGFFAPHAGFASAGARAAGAEGVLREFKGMVRLLHEAGIQVFLDVVYNHTAEEGRGGPTTSLRGIDGAHAYRWTPAEPTSEPTSEPGPGPTSGPSESSSADDASSGASAGRTGDTVADTDEPVAPEADGALTPVADDDGTAQGSPADAPAQGAPGTPGDRDAAGPGVADPAADPDAAEVGATPVSPAASYFDTTGCGNTLDTTQEAMADLVLDSLRYWATEIRVDGFRFDLMASLARNADHVFDPAHPLLERIRQDEALRDVTVVAEPWDVGPDGWRTGAFGVGTSEWNDGFRNTVRQFWLTDIAEERRNGTPHAGIGALAGALTGSRHVFGPERGPLASVNFVTAHDGFTLLDLVSYDGKHNEANGEENRDGTNDNRSFNHGHEGDSADRGVRAARGRSMRNLLGTLVLSAGIPMITAGDERSRTQHGNNNAYVVSDDLTPVDWSDDEDAEAMTEAVAALTRLRAEHPALRPSRFGVDGRVTPSASRMAWYGPDGQPMTAEGWDQPIHRAVQYFVESTPEHEPHDRVLVVVHGTGRTRDITLPVRDDVLAYRLAWSSEKHRDLERPRPAGTVFSAYGPGIHLFEVV